MLKSHMRHLLKISLLSTLLIILFVLPATAGLNDLFGPKEIDEEERAQTIERIENIQEKLKLLQEKLRALERRKTYREAAKRAEETGSAELPNVQINWLGVDETKIDPGEAGVYTYLLFKGNVEDTEAIGMLEDFILTIETLPAAESNTSEANRFILPVEKPQSNISLGRQPYNFKLNEAYLRRLGLQDDTQNGPVLVSMTEPVDPYGIGDMPIFLAVSFGRQAPDRALELAEAWHRYKAITGDALSTISDLFMELIEGAGPTTVVRDREKVLVNLSQQ